MKELILENPPRKKGKKRRTAAQRRATAKMLAANRARRRGKTAKRRKTSKARKSYKPSRSIKALVRSMKTRKSSRRRRKTRTYLVRGTASPIKLNGMIGTVFSRENLTIAGGAVAATVLTNYALGSGVAQRLPGVTNPYARSGYMLVAPILGALVVRRFSGNLAKGLVIGGLANGIAQLLTAANVGPSGIAAPTLTARLPGTAAANEYLGEYLGAGDLTGSEDPGAVGAFSDSAWN
jgi:hypothetical protein